MAGSGIEMMMKALGIDPAQIIETAKGIGETVIALKNQMDRIEKNQQTIMLHLGIPPVEQVALSGAKENGTEEHGSGSG